MKILACMSELMIPFLLFTVISGGLLSKRDIYSDFLEGATEGLKIIAGICPVLIGLMTAVGILRASGFLEVLGKLLGRFTVYIGLPAELIPLSVVRLFSSSAATGLLLDIFKEFGADSSEGMTGAVIMSATESVFYCMSVYFGCVKITRTRYTLPGALLASGAGVAAAVWVVRMMGM